MNRDYNLTGTKIIMRRLFLYDTEAITDCYRDFDSLFFNPVDKPFADEVFMHGEFWGAFLEDTLIACCYYFPFGCSFFRRSSTAPLIEDFIPHPDEYLVMGYIGINSRGKNFFEKQTSKKPAHSIFGAFLNIAEMQAFRRGLRHILYYTPLKLTDCIDSPIRCGFRLVRLRGLDKLVVHYIFDKPVYSQHLAQCGNTDAQCVALSDTKQLSRLLENGWCGVEVFTAEGTAMVKLQKSVTD